MNIGADDLRAAVAAGILTEPQTAALRNLAEARAGRRSLLPPGDEPFEFFRGFAEVFISVGLVILLTGAILALGMIFEGGTGWGGALLLLLLSGFCWLLAEFFTRKRRLILPSMIVVLCFAGAIVASIILLLLELGFLLPDSPLLVRSIAPALAIGALGTVGWYARFRLPFAAFVAGLCAFGAIIFLISVIDPLAWVGSDDRDALSDFFDLRESPYFATATLVFGLVAFAVAMWFDTRDPHRLGRQGATGFWLHLLAAPALVNTVALTLYNSDTTGGIVLLVVVLAAIAALALVIDRRSFLTAALVYVFVVVWWVVGEGDFFGLWALVFLGVGAGVTAIGTWWVQIRGVLMRALPDFPGKSRLPPYGEAE
jgi:hypothetical protein